MASQRIGIFAMLLLVLVISACGAPSPAPIIPTLGPTSTLVPIGAPTLQPTQSATPTGTAVPSATNTATSLPTLPVIPVQTSTPAAAPTLARTPTPTLPCDSAVFVADVTVPDGTLLAAGQGFNKIWRLRNTGTCTWSQGYAFSFIGGTAMTAVRTIAVPPTAPGATVDLIVPMTAPGTAGAFTGFWRLRNPGGFQFGESVWVKINVTAPAAAPPPPGCVGTPIIASFTISPATITAGGSATLSWGLVSNAQGAFIDNDIGGVATPGSMTVSPTTTTTYTMTALCGTTTVNAQVTVTVVPPPATATATRVPPSPTPTRTLTPTRRP